MTEIPLATEVIYLFIFFFCLSANCLFFVVCLECGFFCYTLPCFLLIWGD